MQRRKIVQESKKNTSPSETCFQSGPNATYALVA